MCKKRTGSEKINRSSEVVKETWKGTKQLTLVSVLCPGYQGSSATLRNSVRLSEILILIENIKLGFPYSMQESIPGGTIAYLEYLTPLFFSFTDDWSRPGVPEYQLNEEILSRRENFHPSTHRDLAPTSYPYMAHVNSTKGSKTKVSHDSDKEQAQSLLPPHDPFSICTVGAWGWIRRYWPHLLTSESVFSNSAPISKDIVFYLLIQPENLWTY